MSPLSDCQDGEGGEKLLLPEDDDEDGMSTRRRGDGLPKKVTTATMGDMTMTATERRNADDDDDPRGTPGYSGVLRGYPRVPRGTPGTRPGIGGTLGAPQWVPQGTSRYPVVTPGCPGCFYIRWTNTRGDWQ